MPDPRLDIRIGAKNETRAAINQAKGGISGLTSSIKGMVGAYLGYASAKKFFDFTIGEAQRSELVYRKLQTVIESTGLSWDKNERQVRSWTSQMQRATKYGDEEVATMLQLLMSYNMELTDAQEAFTVAADLSAAKIMDLRTAVDLVAKASVGYTGTLSRYGIILDENLSKEGKYQEFLKQAAQFSGAAAAETETLTGQWAQLNNELTDLGQVLGESVLPQLTEVIGRIKETSENANDTGAIEGLAAVFSGLASTVIYVGDSFFGFWDSIDKAGNKAIEFMLGVENLDEIMKEASTGIRTTEKSVRDLRQAYEELTGVNIPPDILSGGSDGGGGSDDGGGTDDTAEKQKSATDELIKFLGESWGGYYDWQFTKMTQQIETWRAAGVEKNLIDQAYHQARMALDDEYWWQIEQSQSNFLQMKTEARDVDYGNLKASMIKQVTLTHQTVTKQQSEYEGMYTYLNLLSRHWAESDREIMFSLVGAIEAGMDGMVNEVTEQIMTGRMDIQKIWKSMADDFMRYFIKAVLDMVSKILVVRLVGLIASIFDTRANDMVAYTQGTHVAQWMTRGITDEFGRLDVGNQITSAISPINSYMPVNAVSGNQVAMQSGGSPGGSNSMNIKVELTGTFIGEETYVREKLIPIIEDNVLAGYSQIALKGAN